MKKVKQVLAILLILILIGLYVSTLVFAIIGSERAMVWLKISIYATIVLPVLLWAYGFIYKMIKDDNEKKGKNDTMSFFLFFCYGLTINNVITSRTI